MPLADALGLGGGGGPRQTIPREKYPRILFLWGPFRVLPVVIESMTITELQYDFLLNPIQADVSIGLAVNAIDNCSNDTVGKGALEYLEHGQGCAGDSESRQHQSSRSPS